MRDVICNSCSELAYQVPVIETVPDEVLFRVLSECTHKCWGCGLRGKVEPKDDGEQAMLVFRVDS